MNKCKQQGFTLVGWIIVLGLIGFFALVAIKMVPVYMEFMNVKGALESLKQDKELAQKSKHEILSLVDRRFYINDVTTVNAKKDVKVAKDGGKVTVSVDYEARRHLMANIDIVATFSETVEAGGP